MHRVLQPEGMEWTLIEGDELSNVKNYEREAKPTLGDAILHCALCSHNIGAQYLCLDIWKHLDAMCVFSLHLEICSSSNTLAVMEFPQIRLNMAHTTLWTLTQYP
jgi:hypothetical protein